MYNEPYKSNLPIRVAVEYQNENGKEKLYTFKIQTDENGYFKIENAPAGKYVLKAIELNVGQSVHVTAASEYGRWQKGEPYRYWGLMSGMMYRNERDLIENWFEMEAESGLIDLGITYLKIRAEERLGGTQMKNYSPNGTPPWKRLSLNQGYRNADFAVVEEEAYEQISDLQMQEADGVINMQSPKSYFGL
jgi:hypothetical protein